jgi:formylglycine-generating enzyme required for sulfatase activity
VQAVKQQRFLRAHEGLPQMPASPAGFMPGLGGSPDKPARRVDLRQVGGRAIAVPAATGSIEGSLLVSLLAAANEIVIVPAGGFWASGAAPSWADDWGYDAHGPWVAFSVIGAGFARVTQRMRWIRPGHFQMGSPKNEVGRSAWEGPRHAVTIRRGFWMFDKACSEALWDAVMGLSQDAKLPLAESARPANAAGSRQTVERKVRGAGFPITEVSWDDVQIFLQTLNALKPGLDLSLPSEAQWEYACRAGTDTPYSFGKTISRDQVCYQADAPVEVGSLPPNGWGLFEMHGNVFEWCADTWHDSYEGTPPDGSARIETEGAAVRVIRGGSWLDYARYVRAAFRYGSDPSSRGAFGFRCARVQISDTASGAVRRVGRSRRGERSDQAATTTIR